MEDIFVNSAAGLEKMGYSLIYGRKAGRETEALCYLGLKGACLNVVVIINGEVVSDPDSRFNALCLRASQKHKGRAKVFCLGVLIGGEAAPFLSANDFDPLADVVKIRWAYDEETKVLTCGEQAPDKFDGVEDIFNGKKAAFKPAAGDNGFIKTKNIIVTYILIAANLFMFALLSIDGGSKNTETLLKYGALYAPLIKSGELYRMFCYMFLHIGAVHLFSNLFALYIFGTRCEKYFGYLRYIIVYVLSGLGCAVLSVIFSGGAVSAGASGAVMGIMGAALSFCFINNIKMDGLDAYVYVLIAVLNLGFGFVFKDIDNAGHIGGFITGLIIGIIYGLYDKKKVLKNEKAL